MRGRGRRGAKGPRPRRYTPGVLGKVLLIALGGSTGALARYGVGRAAVALSPGLFPLGTLAVNVAGCLAIGVIMLLAVERRILPESWQLLLATGFLGSLTTFSTFGYETFHLLRRGHAGLAFANVAANLALGFLAVWLGWALARSLWPQT